jgi:phospholipid-binding lipoprotein MlaA
MPEGIRPANPGIRGGNLRRIGIVALLGLCLAGCAGASATQAGDRGDPYEATNRQTFAFDMWLDRTFLLPTAKNYNAIVPEAGRGGIHNLLDNLDKPVTFGNDVLQGEAQRAGETALRFTINSTLGLGGLFDPATTNFKLPNHSEDFGQTLGVWGVSGDPYIILPALGPSSPRDVAGRVGDYAMDPLTWIPFKQHIWWLGGRMYFKVLDARARNIDTLEGIERDSVDFYAATRSLYRQYRQNEIRNGKPDSQDLPDL